MGTGEGGGVARDRDGDGTGLSGPAISLAAIDRTYIRRTEEEVPQCRFGC